MSYLKDEPKDKLNFGQSDDFKFDGGKNPLSLISSVGLWLLGKVYQYGAKKYSPNGWFMSAIENPEKASWRRIADATKRHLELAMMGENLDDESGLPHFAQAAWGCLTLATFWFLEMGNDDRVKLDASAIAELKAFQAKEPPELK